jgi:hypothetical protein
MALAHAAMLPHLRRHHRRAHRHRNSTERRPSLDGAERFFESRTIFTDSMLQQSAPRSCTVNVRAMVRARYRNATGDRNQIS